MKLFSFIFVLLLAGSATFWNTINAACFPFTFHNGSIVSFFDTSKFVGWYRQMQSDGQQARGEKWDWGMSLCDYTIQPFGSPACAQNTNMVQSSECVATVAGNPTITSLDGGNGVIFTFVRYAHSIATVGQRISRWSVIVNCICDPTQNKMISHANTYTVDGSYDASVATWVMRSSGCCIDRDPAPACDGGLWPWSASRCDQNVDAKDNSIDARSFGWGVVAGVAGLHILGAIISYVVLMR